MKIVQFCVITCPWHVYAEYNKQNGRSISVKKVFWFTAKLIDDVTVEKFEKCDIGKALTYFSYALVF